MSTADDRPTNRRLISYRMSLLLAISSLTIVTGGLIIGNSYVRGRATVESIARRLFREVSERAVMQAQSRLGSAIPATETLAMRMRQHLLATDPDTLAREMLVVLRSNPEFTWVSYGDAHGTFTGVYRAPDGTIRLNESTFRGAGSEVDEWSLDASDRRTLIRHAVNAYDPRTRPWYALAAQARRRVWTPPYVFYDQTVPGITCAVPYLGDDGSVLGVVTVDFDLNALSRFVSRLHPSANAVVFVFTRDGSVIAHPRASVVHLADADDDSRLMNVTEIADPVVRTFIDAVRTRHGIGTAQRHADFDEDFRFASGGSDYYASYNGFEIDGGVDWVAGAIAPESDFMAGVHRNNVTSLAISLLAVAAALAIAAFLAQRIAGPLAQLAREMEAAGAFKIEDRPEHPTLLREVAMMNRALASMKTGLRSFASFVPHDLVRAMLATGQGAELGGKTRRMTVFFSDLRGFTSIAEQLSPDELVALLGGYLDAMTRIIAEHGGTVDKFIGDGIMAFWGAPNDEPDHAVLACEAALACDRKLAALRDTGANGHERLFARIGIATGDVLVGNIGTPQRMNYTVMGDVVNLASRLEGLNKLFGTSLLVGEETVRSAGDRVVARPIDVVAVKGRVHGVKVYELLGRADDADDAMRETARRSTEALDCYLRREFARAAELFDEVMALRPGDVAARTMADRARRYLASPPPSDWAGVHVATDK